MYFPRIFCRASQSKQLLLQACAPRQGDAGKHGGMSKALVWPLEAPGECFLLRHCSLACIFQIF